MDALIRQNADLFFVVDASRDKVFLEAPVRRLRFLQDAFLLAHVLQQQLDVVSQRITLQKAVLNKFLYEK